MDQLHAKSLTYFAADGSFGDADNITIVDTSEWSQSDWDHVELESDHNRVFIARTIAFTKELENRGIQN